MPNQQSNNSQSGFWFGLIMGGVVGGGALYFLGTDAGRKRLRDIIDTVENLDDSFIEEMREMLEPSGENGERPAVDIHSVLDKIQSSIPAAQEVKKFFVKDGKILK